MNNIDICKELSQNLIKDLVAGSNMSEKELINRTDEIISELVREKIELQKAYN